MMAPVVYFISKIYGTEIRWMIHYGEGTGKRGGPLNGGTDDIEEY